MQEKSELRRIDVQQVEARQSLCDRHRRDCRKNVQSRVASNIGLSAQGHDAHL